MKILHIGDIHLGCTLENRKRNAEIEKVFSHLTDYVRENGIKAALLAGDVFDKGDPSNESRELYYRFLLNLQLSGCRQVIIIAGNHDNSSFLDAPQALLKQMNIHIIGNVSPDHLEKEVIALGDAKEPEAYVCAVPYLNERDIRVLSPEGESTADRDAAVARGIEKHYRDVFQIADRKRNGRNIPVIGMGHLYADGSTFATSADAGTPVGNLNSVDLSAFADGYAYMALGHLHKPQIVRGHENWRYAGSILPMNLREYAFIPQVVLLDTADLSHPVIHELPSACFHEMKVIQGNMEELRRQLNELDAAGREIWIKVVYTDTEIHPNWSVELRQEFRDRKIQILITDVQQENAGSSQKSKNPETEKTLAQMTPEDVFLDYLNRKGEVTDPEQMNMYLTLFRQSMCKVCNPAEQKEKETPPVNRGIMKFERLYIKNVNSLYGENLIDFTVPEFREGIFLISGNTGSGKSSILDAICLALFGTTPREMSVSKRAFFSNQRDCVMSEGTNEVQAELTFTLSGVRYRTCFYHQRSIRGKDPFGQVKHRLYKNDVQIPGTSSEIKDKIISLIGMDQTQFCRCVLLAQGSFDAFLKAEAKDRSDILKNITGTEIYSEIGKQINQDYFEVKTKYETARQALDGITLLTAEEQLKLQENKETVAQKIRNFSEELKIREGVETVFQSIDQAKSELQKASEQVAVSEKNRLLAIPRREELEEANRALNCEKSFRQFQNVQKQQKDLLKFMSELKQQQPLLEKNADELKKKHAELEQKLKNLAEQQKTDQAIFQEIRLLDNQISSVRNLGSSAEKELVKAHKQLDACLSTFQNAEKKWTISRQKAEEAQVYCGSHAADKELPQLKTAWNLRREQLASDEKRNADEKRNIKTLRAGLIKKKQALEHFGQVLHSLEEKKKSLAESLEKSKHELDSLLLGKTCQELQESWAAAVKLDELFKDSVQRREYLTSGEPCPLCGSRQHPYCEGTPVPDCKEFENAANALLRKINNIGTCQEKISKTDLEKGKCEAEITASQARITEMKIAISTEEKAEKEQSLLLEDHVRETNEKITALTDELQKTLQVHWTDHSAMPEELDKRILKFEKMNTILLSLDADKAEYEKAGSVFSAMKPQLEDAFRQKKNALDELSDRLKNMEQERFQKFGKKIVEDEEKKLADAVESCRTKLKIAAADAVKAGEQIRHNLRDQQKNQMQQDSLTAEFKQAETQFSADLQQYGFSSADDFSAKRRDTQHIQQLTVEIQKIDNSVNTAKAAFAERRKILDEAMIKLPEGAERTANLEQIGQFQLLCDDLQRELNSIEVSLQQAENDRKKYEECGKKTAALNMEFNNWKFLDDNFGSASVDRFGRIAQGYTFRELLQFANHNRLRSLQKHFTLVNDDKDPLELNVVDHYRGDQVRTSRNLSGGESFEVSLALALGLAEMSAISQNASLGNVLLDEGFGTLDDDALESALELLMQLRRTDQKLVGIISHVSKLKDRINTRIEVTSNGGMGSLSGAGVIKVPAAIANVSRKKNGRKKTKPDIQ